MSSRKGGITVNEMLGEGNVVSEEKRSLTNIMKGVYI